MLANLGRVDEAIALVDAADRADVRREPDNVVARANLCSLLRFFKGEDVPLEDLEAWAEEAVRGRQPGASARVTNVYSVTLAMRGPAAALAFIDTWAPRLQAIGVDPVRLVVERVQALLFTGRPADAVVAADDLLERPLPTTFVGVTLIARAEACCQMGRFADAEASLRRAEPYITDDWSSRGESLTTAAHVALLAGRPREAIALAESAMAVPTHYAGNYQLTALIRAWAQVELGVPPSPLPEATASWVRDAATAEMAVPRDLRRRPRGDGDVRRCRGRLGRQPRRAPAGLRVGCRRGGPSGRRPVDRGPPARRAGRRGGRRLRAGGGARAAVPAARRHPGQPSLDNWRGQPPDRPRAGDPRSRRRRPLEHRDRPPDGPRQADRHPHALERHGQAGRGVRGPMR